jgi:outer membrane lipoprotein carrier protein
MHRVVWILLAFPVAGWAQSSPNPEALARSLQTRYQGIRDFTADFVQTYRGGVLRTETRERGSVSIKKPGRMRWVYSSPERKEFVSDGLKMYSYIPEDRQVLVSSVPAADEASTSVLFLAGKGDLVKDFTPSIVDSSIPGTVALKLTRRPCKSAP